MSTEARRAEESRQPGSIWMRWGPYLAERQSGAVQTGWTGLVAPLIHFLGSMDSQALLDDFDRPTPASTKRAARRKA
jgi:hypothetical protein